MVTKDIRNASRSAPTKSAGSLTPNEPSRSVALSKNVWARSWHFRFFTPMILNLEMASAFANLAASELYRREFESVHGTFGFNSGEFNRMLALSSEVWVRQKHVQF